MILISACVGRAEEGMMLWVGVLIVLPSGHLDFDGSLHDDTDVSFGLVGNGTGDAETEVSEFIEPVAQDTW
jgi:hypothetical protein